MTPITCRALWDLPNQCLGITCGIWFEGHLLGIAFLSKSEQELWVILVRDAVYVDAKAKAQTSRYKLQPKF